MSSFRECIFLSSVHNVNFVVLCIRLAEFPSSDVNLMHYLLFAGKAKRLKQAKEEAQAEIDGYRKQREDQYKKYEKSVSLILHRND